MLKMLKIVASTCTKTIGHKHNPSICPRANQAPGERTPNTSNNMGPIVQNATKKCAAQHVFFINDASFNMALMATVFTRRAAQHVFFINDASFAMPLLHRLYGPVLAQSEMATIPARGPKTVEAS